MSRSLPLLAAVLLSGCGHLVGTVMSVPSPSGRSVATVYSESGQGMLRYCYACVEVRPNGSRADERAPCRENKQRVACQPGLQLKWRGESEVWLGYQGGLKENAPARQKSRGAPDVEVFFTPLKPRARD